MAKEPKKIIITVDEYLNFKGVQHRLRLNREESIRLLNKVREGYLNPEAMIDKIIVLLEKDEIL